MEEPIGSEPTPTPKRPTRPGPRGGRLVVGPGPGRPKGPGAGSVVACLKEALAANDDALARKMAKALVGLAIKGNPVAIRQILDRTDGPVLERMDLTNNGGAFDAVRIYLPHNGRNAVEEPSEEAEADGGGREPE